ncbi:hypothetical protein ZYGR_0AD02990 [Zygosaccharomyces rouxii]|uniref:Uncharacterized protein n=1 Tax=Zygosaccharomyces rouxii TaxID=4956 RepID=A0A1Q3A5V3_ZYGRO|nr:hypothetical protein LQ764DRAFT_35549 [Zygosaccharomyces rouxii]GAV51116.1 hypothetical protein ZYGR_0AD02990 [Zygosaccharomyces rouxii]
MITHVSEWIFELIPSEPSGSTRVQKRHILFPAIVANQFISGSPEYIPILHDGINDELDDDAAEPLNSKGAYTT